jgi:alkanesulfonate monooxygenase SsuD/methylene tetrahydromethanopterin reductase-like flavin-dependent oxidoreductase (luciferase family)
MRLGVLLLEEDMTHCRALAQRADEAGVDSAWTIEYYNRNSLVRLAAMAASTRRLTVGTAVTAAFARAPLMLATAVADLATMAPGRVVLGLGSSTPRMNSDWYGTAIDHPAPRIEELIDLLRKLEAHHEGPFGYDGRFYTLRFAHLDRLLSPPVPIYTAGVNPRMVEVAGRVADGFVGHPIATVPYLLKVANPAIDTGTIRSGRETTAVHRVTQVITAIDDDPAAARRRAALQVAFYSTVKTYEVIFALHGFVEERERIRVAFLRGDKTAMVAATSDAMLAEMAVFGTREQVAQQLDRYSTWADELILYPPHFGVTTEELRTEQLSLIDLIGELRTGSHEPERALQ